MITDRQREEILDILPRELSSAIFRCSEEYEEIRLIAGAPLSVTADNKIKYVSDRGLLTGWMTNCPFVNNEDVKTTFENLCRKSKFDCRGELIKGHIVTPSGVRAGIAGQAVYADGEIKNITQITAIVFRFSRITQSRSNKLIETIWKDNKPISTLIISEPYMGKTTMLRDVCNQLSGRKLRVCAVDDNYELSCFEGALGRNTIVLRGFDKLSGAEICVRNLSPQTVVFDEITTADDARAVTLCALMGVSVIATCHATGFADIMRRSDLNEAFRKNIFGYAALISENVGHITRIISAEEICKEYSAV